MSSETDRPKEQDGKDESDKTRITEEEKLDRIANEAAQRAGRREQRYDADHGMFSK